MKDIKLKPCPFCGGIAHFIETSNNFRNNLRTTGFRAECCRCHASIPNTYYLLTFFNGKRELETIKDERKEAAEAWNSRA